MTSCPRRASRFALLLAIGLPVVAFAGPQDEDVPAAVQMQPAQTSHLSPANNDGLNDELIVAFTATPVARKVIAGYALNVTNASGEAVFVAEESRQLPERVGQRRAQRRQLAITLPPAATWTGVDRSGAQVPDGTYTYQIQVVDNLGVEARSTSAQVVVDNTAPMAQVGTPYFIFSPNGDGAQDDLPFEQTGSDERLWVGELFNAAGTVVASRRWESSAPLPFTWDGTGTDGSQLADGTYRYRLSSTDEAGNSNQVELADLVIDTRAVHVALNIDRQFLSPNGDGVMDTVTLTPNVPPVGEVVQWAITVPRLFEHAERTIRGTGPVPAQVVFDGRATDGSLFEDGEYRARLAVVFANGDHPTADSPPFVIDTEPPRGSVQVQDPYLSPNGDGNKDAAIFLQTAGGEAEWRGVLTNRAGAAVRTVVWQGTAAERFEWAGNDDQGNPVPDGVYTYRLTATDRAGNRGAAPPVTVTKDNRATPVTVAAQGSPFSPNGDGARDSMRLVPAFEITEGVERSTLTIRSAQGTVVRRLVYEGVAPTVEWDGTADNGQPVADGEYRATLTAVYRNGNRPQATGGVIIADTNPPSVRVTAPVTWFSPDGDGRVDSITIEQNEASSEPTWIGVIRGPAGREVRRFEWTGTPADSVSWDGRDARNAVVADGAYSYLLSATDRAGNTARFEVAGIRVDNRPTPVTIAAAATAFSPNGDGVKDVLDFAVDVTVRDGIARWSAAVENAAGAAIGALGAAGAPPTTLQWDGRMGDQQVAGDGTYRATLTVEFQKGNVAQSRSAGFRVDVTPPALTLTLRPQPFSPDGDGIDDQLTIELAARDAGAITEWLADVTDPGGNQFFRFAGQGAPPNRLSWDGKSRAGVAVEAASDYPVAFQAVDDVGNRASVQRNAVVDVLVIRDGDQLRIRIPSIQFAAWTADLDRNFAANNTKVLTRLAEILNRFPQHRIRVEGHAVRIFWFDEQRGRTEEQEVLGPLSQQRAELVVAALVDLGVARERMTAVGQGGTRPLVANSDVDNRWKNRRVEFILVR